MKRILLPVDGTTTCGKAIKYARDLAENFESEVIIFNSQEVIPTFVWLNDPVIVNNTEYDPERIAKEIVEETSKCFENSDVKLKLITRIGDPAHTILEIADEENCDLIIMSTHGMKAVKRFLLGSVTNKIVHHAEIPVLVVR